MRFVYVRKSFHDFQPSIIASSESNDDWIDETTDNFNIENDVRREPIERNSLHEKDGFFYDLKRLDLLSTKQAGSPTIVEDDGGKGTVYA